MSLDDLRPHYRHDYPLWHRAQVTTGDIDPVYPIHSGLNELWDLSLDEAVWMTFLHVAFYNPGSTLAAMSIAPTPEDLPPTTASLDESGLLSLPCGVERRGHRDPQMLARHLVALRAALRDGPDAWVSGAIAGASTPKERWLALNSALVRVYGNGRWAAYKTAEMLQKVNGYDVEATDAGHRYSTGPRKGLEILEPFCPTGNGDKVVAMLDYLTAEWADELEEPDLAQVETSLCDFYSLSKGRYYLGHDIDSLLASYKDPRVAPYVTKDVWDLRRETFPLSLLGEVYGWDGVRKERKTHYRDTGEILDLELAEGGLL